MVSVAAVMNWSHSNHNEIGQMENQQQIQFIRIEFEKLNLNELNLTVVIMHGG